MGACLPAIASSNGTRVCRGNSMNFGNSRSFCPYSMFSNVTGDIDCQFITVVKSIEDFWLTIVTLPHPS